MAPQSNNVKQAIPEEGQPTLIITHAITSVITALQARTEALLALERANNELRYTREELGRQKRIKEDLE